MEEPAYPNLRQGIRVGLVSGILAAILAFLGCVCVGVLPAVSEVSLSLSFRPWWRWSNWAISLFFFVIFAVGVGIIAAFRPNVGRKSR